MRRLDLLALTAVATASLAAGCGGSSSSGDSTASASGGPSQVSDPAQGIRFTAPAGWTVQRGADHLVATVRTDGATVVVWRYARSARLPRTRAELRAARIALLHAERRRDPTFREIKGSPTTVDGQPAVQIRALEHIAGQRQLVRATHIYAHGAEIVVQAYADAGTFRTVDAQAFRPVVRSLRLISPQGAR